MCPLAQLCKPPPSSLPKLMSHTHNLTIPRQVNTAISQAAQAHQLAVYNTTPHPSGSPTSPPAQPGATTCLVPPCHYHVMSHHLISHHGLIYCFLEPPFWPPFFSSGTCQLPQVLPSARSASGPGCAHL